MIFACRFSCSDNGKMHKQALSIKVACKKQEYCDSREQTERSLNSDLMEQTGQLSESFSNSDNIQKGMIYMTNMTIARNIRRLRSSRNITQSELARSAGIAGSYLCECEKGRRMPSIRVVTKLAAALGCQISDIVDDHKERSAG